MPFGKKTHLVGLDIGSRTIKVGELSDTKKGYSLKHFGAIDIASGLIEEGVVREPEVVAGAVRELFRSHRIKEKNVAISIGGYSVIVKKINVQAMSEEELLDTIHYEAEQYIPFDISDVNLDFQILGEADNNPEQMSILLVAAKKDMIADYMNLVQLAGLNPCIIDVDAFALQNIFEINYAVQEEVVALIDIGSGKTSLNIVKDGSSLFMRDVSLGCGQINDRIISQIGCSPEEAEALKCKDKQERISIEALSEIVGSVTSDWCAEIRRALDYFYSTDGENQVRRIVLSGGGANIERFHPILAAETSAKVEIFDSFANIAVSDKQFDIGYLKRYGAQAAICLGLALRRIDDK